MKSEGKKKLFLIIGVIFIFLIYQIVSLYGGQYPIVNFPPKGGTIVALGDSLTEGVGASTPENGYVGVLERRLGVTIVNRGISGNTTADALSRIDTEIIPLHPNIVIVLLGGNDYLKKIPQQETFTNLSQIIKKLQSDGAVVLVLGVRGGLLHDKFNDDFKTLAKETGSLYVSNVLDGIFGSSKLMSDEVHPNDAGYMKIADKIAPTLDSVVLSIPASITHLDPPVDTVRTSPSTE